MNTQEARKIVEKWKQAKVKQTLFEKSLTEEWRANL